MEAGSRRRSREVADNPLEIVVDEHHYIVPYDTKQQLWHILNKLKLHNDHAANPGQCPVEYVRYSDHEPYTLLQPGEELVDAPLTDVGRQQAAGLVPQAAGVSLDVVIVSPLVRAIETATIGLAAHLERGVPFVVEELCREQLGPNLPDKRRPKDALAAAHPALDFSAMPDGEDALFMTEQPSKVEGVAPVAAGRPARRSCRAQCGAAQACSVASC